MLVKARTQEMSGRRNGRARKRRTYSRGQKEKVRIVEKRREEKICIEIRCRK